MARQARGRPQEPSLIPARMLTLVGKTLYGHRWQHQLADACGVSQALVSMMVRELRPITRDVVAGLARLAEKQAAELRGYATQLNLILDTEGRK